MIQFKNYFFLSLVLWTLHSCSTSGNSDSKDLKDNGIDTNLILFPHITPDTTFINGSKLQFNFTDSTPVYNAISSNQAVFIYSLQLEKPSMSFDSVSFFIKMPNRENKNVSFTMSIPEFEAIEMEYSNPIYKQFLKELLKLNYKTRNRYHRVYSSLLSTTNLIFAEAINKKYTAQFPNNSTLFGYNSFHIFGMYFGEVNNGNSGIAHDLMNSLKNSKDQLNEYDKKSLLNLVEKYAAKFKPAIQ